MTIYSLQAEYFLFTCLYIYVNKCTWLYNFDTSSNCLKLYQSLQFTNNQKQTINFDSERKKKYLKTEQMNKLVNITSNPAILVVLLQFYSFILAVNAIITHAHTISKKSIVFPSMLQWNLCHTAWWKYVTIVGNATFLTRVYFLTR